MNTKPEIIEETPVPMYEVKQEIAKIKKRDEELNFRGQKTEEYLNTFVTLKITDYKSLIDDLNKLKIPRLKDEHIFKLADVLPETVDEVKLTLQGYTLTVSQDNMKKIAETVKKYSGDKKTEKA